MVVGIVKEGGGQPTVVFLTDLHEKNQVARLLALVVNGIVGDIVIVSTLSRNRSDGVKIC